jgi:hypothetical protein
VPSINDVSRSGLMVFTPVVVNLMPLGLAPLVCMVSAMDMSPMLAVVPQGVTMMRLMAMALKALLLLVQVPLMAFVLGMRGRMPFLVAVVLQVPKVLALRMLFKVLEARPLVMVPPLVVRLLVRMIVCRTTLELVRMAQMRDVTVRLVPPVNNVDRHKPSPTYFTSITSARRLTTS